MDRARYETAVYLFLCRHNERFRTGKEKPWSRAFLVAVNSLFKVDRAKSFFRAASAFCQLTPKFPAAHEFKNLY